MYARSADGICINLFIGSTTTIPDAGGTDIEIVQQTDYPWNGKVSLIVNPKAPKRFTVRVRVPNRSVSRLYRNSPDADGIASIAINGDTIRPTIDRGYAVIVRSWKRGDRIDLVLPMQPQRIKASNRIAATRNKVALRYGPLIYNIEQADQDIGKALAPDSALAAEWRPDFLAGVVVITGAFADGTPMLAIPNFARMNREAGLPLPPPRPAAGPDGRRAPRPPRSIVWMAEA
jgi:DUF1680 family protein